jgi:hypothetical protein
MGAKIFLAAALNAVPLGAFAQPPNTSAVREIARIDGEYSDLSVAKGMPAASVEYFAASFVINATFNPQPTTLNYLPPSLLCPPQRGSLTPVSRHFRPVSDGVPFCLALKPGLWQKRKHDAVFHGRQRAQQADYTDFICL